MNQAATNNSRRKEEVLRQLKGKLIVSCQARVGWPMYGAEIMAAFAAAACQGGAAGIRATGVDNITKIKERVSLPIIGINKQFRDDYEVYITPTYESAREILETGIEIVAIDATPRQRPGGETVGQILARIREDYPDVMVMGEISTIEEAEAVIPMGFDLISTTLSGYTKESECVKTVNLELIRRICAITDIPVIAEGKIAREEEAVMALKAGAHAVVVGTSITRPEIITERYVGALKEYGAGDRCNTDGGMS
ncbi:N-acetylmannosamine-6-phosphate 2-epimerase [Clostridiaceae bacterium]|nr:N-acetylmannosamine-6-phosphate 2-epimerase [Clostridiaceae bacterium]RKI15020.1 N-acetylmannosamine-6-phosphate 2-epimerase [bacterium 1XD21-70]